MPPIRVILLVVFSFISITSKAEVITFNWLGSTVGQKSALSGRCETIEGGMQCNLRQLSVSIKLTQQEADEKIYEGRSEIDAALEKLTPREFVDDGLSGVCKKLRSDVELPKEVDQETLELVKRLCQKPNKEDLYKLTEITIKRDSQTCKISDWDLGDFYFKKVSHYKWVSNNGPTGECGAVVIMQLERHPEHEYLWTYSQSKQYTSLDSEMCKRFNEVNIDQGFSWNAPKPIKTNCQYIEFAL